MKKPKFRELMEAIRSLLSRPYTASLPVPPGFRGVPRYDEKNCVGCGACAEVCPPRAIEIWDDKKTKMRRLTHRQDVCIFCGQCERACITEKGIKLSAEYNLATFDRSQAFSSIEKELVICENCGEIAGCLDHLKYLARKVGPLLYANPTLLLARHDELKLIEKDLPDQSPHWRAGHLQMLCPNCRREMILKEQW